MGALAKRESKEGKARGMLHRHSFRWLFPVVFVVTGNALALPCTARTPEAAVQQWSRQQPGSTPLGPAKEAMALVDGPAQRTGYRVQRTMADPILGRQWALVVDCVHPQRPPVAVLLDHFHAARRPAQDAATSSSAGLPTQRAASLPTAVASPGSPSRSSMAHSVMPQAPSAGSGKTVLASAPSLSPDRSSNAGSPAPSPVLVRAGDRVLVWNQEPQLRLEIAAVALEYGRAGQVVHLRRSGLQANQNITMTGVVRGPGSVELMP